MDKSSDDSEQDDARKGVGIVRHLKAQGTSPEEALELLRNYREVKAERLAIRLAKSKK